jgi:putative CocE/NonD family hydrolase
VSAVPVERNLAVTAADGTRLLVDHHLPRQRRDAVRSGVGQPGAGAVVWIRTPYGRKGIASIAQRFAKAGAHVVVEALRGTDGCGGRYYPFTVTPSDAAEVLGWLRTRPWFPGTVVTWGISAIGYGSWALTELDVPEWRLAILQDAPSELRDGAVYPGGIFAGKLPLGFLGGVEWLARHWRASLPRTRLVWVRAARRATKVLTELPLGTADQRLVGHRVEYFQDWLAREHDEEYWKPFDRRRGAPGMVHLATGWYDLFLGSALADYRALRQAGKTVRLVVGPWYHGRGAIDKTYRADRDTWLQAAAGRTTPPPGAPVRVHVGGAGQWRDLPDWPPPGYRPTAWHLHPGGALRTDPAPPSSPDRYRYDPARPTPAVGGAIENWERTAGAKDNRKLERRPDVLTYTSDPLTHDLEVIGPVSATVAVRSTREHTDLLARLCDVHPDGRSVNLCDGGRRLRPGQPATAPDGTRTVELDLVAVAHVFRAGHRLRLQVSSGAHPRLARNPGTGEPLATATNLRPADQEVFHDPEHPSTVTLPHAPR